MATIRLIAKMPTLAAFAYRHNLGLPYVYPDNDLDYPSNFLSMMFKMTELKYEPDPRLSRALDVLWILHADHEQNCSTNAVRAWVPHRSTRTRRSRPASRRSTDRSTAARTRPSCKMLERIGSVDNIPDFLQGVKDRKERLMGFGHRVYKNYDPRARIIKKHVDDVLEVTGQEPEARDRGRAREARARRRLLHEPQAVPERRLLLGPDLRGTGPADRRCSR